MGKVTQLKKRADSMLEEIFRSLFEDIDTEKIRRDVAALKESAPGDYQPADYAHMLARRTAFRCAAAGAVTGLPAGFLAIGTLGADLVFLMYQQFRLIIGIATIYGHEASSRERFTEALSCLAYASGVGIGKLNYVSVRAVARAAIRYYESRIDPELADEIWNEGDREHA